MNYQGNRGIITTTLDNPTLFNNLQSELAGKTTKDTPLLLMPLRLETRFMRVRRNPFEDVLSQDVIGIATLSDELTDRIKHYNLFGQYTDRKAALAANLVYEDIARINDKLNSIPNVNFLEREIITGITANLQELSGNMSGHLRSFIEDNSPVLGSFESHAQEMATTTSKMSDRLNAMPESNEWQDSIGQEVAKLRDDINSVIVNNAELINNGNAIDNTVQVVSENMARLNEWLNSVQSYNGGERLAVYQQLSTVNAQVAQLSQLIQDNPEMDEQQRNNQKKNLYKATAPTINTWQGILFNGLERDTFVDAVPDAHIIDPDHQFTDSVLTAQAQLAEQVNNIRNLYRSLIYSGQQWEPGSVNVMIDHLHILDDTLSNLPAVDDVNDKRFLYQALDGLNDMVYNVTDFLKTNTSIEMPGPIVSAQETFRAAGDEIYDNEGNPINRQGGYTVSENGAIQKATHFRITLKSGFKVVNNVIMDLEDRPVSPAGGYSISEGMIVTPSGEFLTDWTGFTIREEQFYDDAGKPLSPAGGYTVDDDLHIVGTTQNSVTYSGMFQMNDNGQITDLAGNPFTRSGGYQVTDAGVVIKMDKMPVDTIGLTDGIHNGTLGISHEWARVIGSTDGIAVFHNTYEVDELWIRAYPDDIFITHHEETLTQDEHDAGVAYWAAWWAANGSKDLELVAWQNLVLKFGPQRAAWIVNQLTPNNFQNSSGVATAQQLSAQVATLQTFSSQIGLVSTVAEQQQSVPYYLSVFQGQVDAMQASANELAGSPEVLFNLLLDNVEQLKTGFTELSAQLVDGGLDVNESTASITNGLEMLKGQIGGMNTPENWSQLYTLDPSFPDVAVKGQAWIEQSYSETLPHRLVFATINQIKDPSNPAINETYSFNHIKLGNIIPDTVYTSLKPDIGDPTDDNLVNTGNIGIDKGPTGELIFDASIKWMFDYNEAVAKGMACSIRLTTKEAKDGFDTVIVTGVKTNEGNFAWSDETKVKTKSKELLEKLLKGHTYSEGGMELLKIGTPTNNTDETDSGFNQPDPYSLDSFSTSTGTGLFSYSPNKLTRKDGQWISDLLGVDYGIFQHVKGANNSQISNGITMNRALWSATVGGYMDEMLDRVFTTDNIARTKAYFSDYVLARGIMPSIRVGEQPYGVLATTSFTRWYTKPVLDIEAFYQTIPEQDRTALINEIKDGRTQDSYSVYNGYIGNNPGLLSSFNEERFNNRLQSLMHVLSNIWLEMFRANVKTIDGINKNVYPNAELRQADFMTALGADATLSEAHIRFMLNAFSYQPTTIASSFDDLVAGKNTLKDVTTSKVTEFLGHFKTLFIDSMPTGPIFDFNYAGTNVDEKFIQSSKIFAAQQMTDHFFLKTPRVDELTLSETLPVTSIPSLNKNYIQWLLDSSLNEIWKNNQFDNLPARSLLFQLLRQSMLLTYRNEVINIFQRSGVLNKYSRNILGTTDGFAMQLSTMTNQRVLTKWHLMFNTLNQLSSDSQLKDVLNCFLNFDGSAISFNAAAPALPTWKTVNIGDYLKSNSTSNATLNSLKSLTLINELKEAYGILKNVPTAELDRLLSEHIDLCSYRLDAWNYGMVHKRLMEQRNVDANGIRKTGLYIGAYGWLLDVRPKTPDMVKPNVNSKIHPLLQSATGEVGYDKLNLGFIHTPSIMHALTAAMMRSGFVSERLADESSFSINLTSQRVKKAIELLEGMRNGQTLSELLGYEFEKGLYDRGAAISGLQEYVAFFRKVFPMIEDHTSVSPVSQAEAIRPANVCDGIDLLNSFRTTFVSQIRANPTYSIYELYAGTISLPSQISGAQIDAWITTLNTGGTTFSIHFASNPAAAAAFVTEIDHLANAMDAVGDIALTEGVFQITRGNHERSAAVMEALTKGNNMPELEVTNTPRTGYYVSNRLVNFMSTTAVPSQFTTPKSSLEPKVNNWVENLLMNYLGVTDIYATIGCKASFSDNTDPQNPITFNVDVLLEDLEINAIELIYMVHNGSYLGELTDRVQYAVRKKWTGGNFLSSGVPASVEIIVDLENHGTSALNTSSGISTTSFADISTMMDAIHNVVVSARFLSPDDFVFSTENATTAAKFDMVNDILPRVNALANQFDPGSSSSVRHAIDTWITAGETAITDQSDLNAINQLLLTCANLGISSAIPKYVKEDDTDTVAFAQIAKDVYKKLVSTQAELIKRYGQITTPVSTATEDDALGIYIENINALLGSKFLFLPKFSFSHYTGLENMIFTQLEKQKSISVLSYNIAEDLLSHADPSLDEDVRDEIMEDWLYSLARVERKIDDIETIKMFTGPGAFGRLRPIQIPFIDVATASSTARDYWIGAEYPDSYELLGDKLSVAIFNSGLVHQPIGPNQYCGIFIHNWEEIIPQKEETTGITFHYDQPNAKAPQNLLLAVHPGCNNASLQSYKSWQVEDLLYTLLDTIEMSKIRLVEPDHFQRKSSDASTNKFDLFKWMLPAVIGEITPHTVNKNDPNNIINAFQGKMDSFQQVSFEYNPMGHSLTNTQTGSTGPIFGPASYEGSINLTDMPASILLQDQNIQNYLTQQNQINALAATIDQLQNTL